LSATLREPLGLEVFSVLRITPEAEGVKMNQNLHKLLLGFALWLFGMNVQADIVEVINEGFDEPVTDYYLYTNITGDATATIEFGDVNGSNGPIFGGTWTIEAGTTASAGGIVAPQTPPNAPFQFDVKAHEGISAIQYSADVKLNGFSGDDLGNLFIQLLIFQNYPDGSLTIYTQTTTTMILPATTEVDVTLLRTDFLDYLGNHPDLSPDASPISFGLLLGALFNDTAFIGTKQGHLSADNLIVNVTVPDLLFEDGYENPD
jgi:hypothetical protein